MDLIIYDRSNTAGTTRQGERTIGISPKGGIINFSTEARKYLGINNGDKVVFAQANKVWFVAKVNDDNETAFTLSGGDKSLLFRRAGLVKKILSDLKLTKSTRFLVSKDAKDSGGYKFYQLIPYK